MEKSIHPSSFPHFLCSDWLCASVCRLLSFSIRLSATVFITSHLFFLLHPSIHLASRAVYLFPLPSLTPTSFPSFFSLSLSPPQRLCVSQRALPVHPTAGSLSHTHANTHISTTYPYPSPLTSHPKLDRARSILHKPSKFVTACIGGVEGWRGGHCSAPSS